MAVPRVNTNVFIPVFQARFIYMFISGWSQGIELSPLLTLYKKLKQVFVCLSVCHFVLVFFSPFSIAITSLGEERANLSSFRTFVRFVLV